MLSSRQACPAWLWPATVFVVLVTATLAGNWRFFFREPVVAWSDHASNDMLVLLAKEGRLFHGVYSRTGFYHPGPFFLAMAAVAELLFFDGWQLFASPVASHFFAALVWAAVAFAVFAHVLRRCSGSCAVAAAGVAILFLVVHGVAGSPLTSAWLPQQLVSSAIVAVAAAIGCLTLGIGHLPLWVFACATLVHGHAAFLGLAPMMSALLLLFWTRARWASLAEPRARGLPPGLARAFLGSAVVVLLFALPIAVETVVRWPGEVPKYLAFARNNPGHPLAEAIAYVRAFFPGAVPALLALVVPLDRWMPADRAVQARRMRFAAVAVLVIGGVPGSWYAMQGIDRLSMTYLGYWLVAFGGGTVAAAYVALASLLPARSRAALSLVVAAGALALAIPRIRPVGEGPGAPPRPDPAVKRYQEAYDVLAQRAGGGALALAVDWEHLTLDTWADPMALLALMNRRGERFLCVPASHWHISFHEVSRCDVERDSLSALVSVSQLVGTGEAVLVRTGGTAFAVLDGPRIGSRWAPRDRAGVLLVQGWSSREPWGVWTDGRRGWIAVDTRNLPERFRVVAQVRVFGGSAPHPKVVTIRTRDGTVLAREEVGEQDAERTMAFELPGGGREGPVVVLELRASRLVSPRALGVNLDERRLGAGLIGLSFTGEG